MGSKNRIAHELIPIIDAYRTKERVTYIEPFVGGANLIDKIVKFQFKHAYDKNPYLIALLNHVASGSELPTTITEDEYNAVKANSGSYAPYYVGLVGFCASFGGQYFTTYPRGTTNDGTPRDYTNEAIRNLQRQSKKLRNITFTNADYSSLTFKETSSVIYCDPPYANTSAYASIVGKFNHTHFWEWVREESKYNPVLVSEYTAPDDIVCIYQSKPLKSNLQLNGTKTSVEKLFVCEQWAGQYRPNVLSNYFA